MADPTYIMPDNPEYREAIRKLQNSDPASADGVFNPLIQALLENVHFVKMVADALRDGKADLVDGKVPAGQLPSYVDDVIDGYYRAADGGFYEDAAFTKPITGEGGKTYVDIAYNKSYRWSGSVFVRVDEGVSLGETAATAYRGDRGKAAYDHSQASGNPHGTGKADVGLGSVDDTRDLDKPVSTATRAALDLKAGKSTQIDATIGTSWGGSAGAWTQTLSISGVTATNVVEVFLRKGATAAQDEAYTALQLRDGGQAAGSITLLAKGDKNTIAVPITVIVRGDL